MTPAVPTFDEYLRIRHVFRHCNEAVLLLDRELRIVYANPAFRAFAPGPAGHFDHAPRDYRDYVTLDEPGASALAEATTGPVHKNIREASGVNAAGERLSFTMSVLSLAGADGLPAGVFVGILDKSDELRLHAKHKRDLEEMERVQRVKTEFLATVSHEIRTPMNGIIGAAGILQEMVQDDPERRQWVEVIAASGGALLGLVNDVLDLSKIEAGKIELDLQDFDLVRMIRDVLAMLSIKARDKGVTLDLEVTPGLDPLVRGDPFRFKQVLTNLVGNAVKFTERGGVVVRLADEGAEEEGRRFLVEVRDTGIGIPEDRRDRLFQPFTQVDQSHSRRYGGTGLGLSIAKKLVELMGGRIGFESRAGEGSTFRFSCVFGRPSGVAAPAGPTQERLVLLREDLGDKRALLAEHNQELRLLYQEKLQSWGWTVQVVESAAEALEILSAHAEDERPWFSLVIVDFHLPDMDGLVLGRRIKELPLHRTVPMILLSRAGVRGEKLEAERAGFSAYLSGLASESQFFDAIQTISHRVGPAIVTRHDLPPAKAGRLLLVEDNPINQAVARKLLTDFGHACEVAVNGVEAVERAGREAFDLIFMDMQMPEMDGLEATRRIRTGGGASAAAPIVAMTANAMQGDREACIAAGMDDYVSKPVSRRILAEVLSRWLRQDPGVVPAARPSQEPPGAGSAPVWDRAGFLERLEGDEDMVRMLVPEFLPAMEGYVQSLRASLGAGDAEAAVRLAHTVKGAAANMGAEQLRAVAAEMERAGKAGDLAGMARRQDALLGAWGRLQSELERAAR